MNRELIRGLSKSDQAKMIMRQKDIILNQDKKLQEVDKAARELIEKVLDATSEEKFNVSDQMIEARKMAEALEAALNS